MRSLRTLARIVPVSARRGNLPASQPRRYSISNRDLYGRQQQGPKVATLERDAPVATEAPERPKIADIVPLKERSVEDRLNDPNLLFEGEDEVPDAHINMIKELDMEFRSLVDQAEDALKDPDVQLFERVCHARTRMLELRWLADPDPPSPMNRMKLEGDIKQMLIDTEAEFDEYIRRKYAGSGAYDLSAAEDIIKRWEKDQRKAAAAEGALGKRMKPLAKQLKKKAKELMKKKQQDSLPLYQAYDKMEGYREQLPGEGANVGASASVDKILAHKKMRAVEKRRSDLAAQGQTFADLAPDGITVEDFARTQRAAELGRSPLDVEDLGLDDDQKDYEMVEVVDPQTGKKKMERRQKSYIEIKEDDMTDMDDEKGLQEDIEEAMRMAEEEVTGKKGAGKGRSLFDAAPGESDPAAATLRDIQKAKSIMALRMSEWNEIDIKRKKRLEEAKAYTMETNRRNP